MDTEIFGPVLHVAKFKAGSIDNIVEDINASGYGLTFGLHTRIDSRVERLVKKLNVGNIYINRDQIGAVVGSQPFGGENLSGTGPKAGGPNYILQFMQPQKADHEKTSEGSVVAEIESVQAALNCFDVQRIKLTEEELTGPTGESNVLYEYGRGVVLCLGIDLESAKQQANIAQENGCQALIVCPGASGENCIDGFLPREHLSALNGFDLVALWSDNNDAALARRSLALREGKIIPLICDDNLGSACRLERHVCVDTTAAGGNASLLASAC
jgi:RHH-type proline utilization regulon transcriptional repressor/proline dehydrogenase/delta 1-pyrroline-5-carboxylate dehydrogenase